MIKKLKIAPAPKTNAEGFVLALRHWADPAQSNPMHGAITRMAADLKVTRQIIHRWEKLGIPLKYKTRLCDLTGLSESHIWPEGFKY